MSGQFLIHSFKKWIRFSTEKRCHPEKCHSEKQCQLQMLFYIALKESDIMQQIKIVTGAFLMSSKALI